MQYLKVALADFVFIRSTITGTNIISFFYIVLLAPIGEELVFRGWMLRNLEKVVRFGSANIIQAFLFALLHQNLIQYFTFVCGYVHAKIYRKYDYIYAPILIYIFINLFGVVLP